MGRVWALITCDLSVLNCGWKRSQISSGPAVPPSTAKSPTDPCPQTPSPHTQVWVASVGIPLLCSLQLLPQWAGWALENFQFAEKQEVSSQGVPSLGLDISLCALKIAMNSQEMAGWKLHYEKHPMHIPGASLYYNALHCCNTVFTSGESGKTWLWVYCTTVWAKIHYLPKTIECPEKTGWLSQTRDSLINSNFICH